MSFKSTAFFSSIWKLISTNLLTMTFGGDINLRRHSDSLYSDGQIDDGEYFMVTIPSVIVNFINEQLGLWNKDLDQDFFTWFL